MGFNRLCPRRSGRGCWSGKRARVRWARRQRSRGETTRECFSFSFLLNACLFGSAWFSPRLLRISSPTVDHVTGWGQVGHVLVWMSFALSRPWLLFFFGSKSVSHSDLIPTRKPIHNKTCDLSKVQQVLYAVNPQNGPFFYGTFNRFTAALGAGALVV